MGIIVFILYVFSFFSFYILRYKLEEREYRSNFWEKHKLPFYVYILAYIGCCIPAINFFVSLSIWIYILTESNIRIKPSKFKNFLTKEV